MYKCTKFSKSNAENRSGFSRSNILIFNVEASQESKNGVYHESTIFDIYHSGTSSNAHDERASWMILTTPSRKRQDNQQHLHNCPQRNQCAASNRKQSGSRWNCGRCRPQQATCASSLHAPNHDLLN